MEDEWVAGGGFIFSGCDWAFGEMSGYGLWVVGRLGGSSRSRRVDELAGNIAAMSRVWQARAKEAREPISRRNRRVRRTEVRLEPAATAAADPLELLPGVCSGFRAGEVFASRTQQFAFYVT